MIRQAALHVFADQIVLCFDGEDAAAFKQGIWPEYKAKRGKRPEDLTNHLREIYRIARDLWPIEAYRGYEADDAIASLVDKAGFDELHRGVILTEDGDTRRLLRSIVIKQLRCKGSQFTVVTEESLLRDLGLTPRQYADYQVLAGDASDEVSGIVGCGDKTARLWLSKFGSLDAIVDAAPALPGPKKAVVNLVAAKSDGSLPRLQQVLSPRLDCPTQWRWKPSVTETQVALFGGSTPALSGGDPWGDILKDGDI